MNPIEDLIAEHQLIERELLEFETIIDDPQTNYPNLIHVLKRLIPLWNNHEIKEEQIFPLFKKERISVPVNEMLFEHRKLRRHKEAIENALNSESDFEVRHAIETHGSIIVTELREHIKKEDNIFYTLDSSEFSPEELEMIKEILASQ